MPYIIIGKIKADGGRKRTRQEIQSRQIFICGEEKKKVADFFCGQKRVRISKKSCFTPVNLVGGQADSHDLDSGFLTLAANPKKGRPCDDIKEGYRKHSVGKHIIFYRMTKKELRSSVFFIKKWTCLFKKKTLLTVAITS